MVVSGKALCSEAILDCVMDLICGAGQDGTEVAVDAVGEPRAGSAEQRSEAAPSGRVRVAPAQPWCGEYAIASARFAAGVVGAKSLNTQTLQVHRKVHVQCAASFGATQHAG